MKTMEIDVDQRSDLGKSKTKVFKKSGRIPAIIYGSKLAPLPVSLTENALLKIYNNSPLGRNTLINLKINDKGKAKEDVVVLSHVVTLHPVSKNIIHVDFLRVDDKKEITTEVPINLIGVSAGQKIGGILIQNARTLSIKCLPPNIPVSIDIDISKLEIGQSKTVDDLDLDSKITILNEAVKTLVHIEAPRVEVEPVEAAEEETGAEDNEEGAGEAESAENGADEKS